jgi:cytoskeletal protein CcmA (bactofilin family)
MGFISSRKQDKPEEEPYSVPRSTIQSKEPVSSSSGPGSFIGKTMDIKADITSDEDVTIEGRVNGNIKVSKTLTIGRNGNVTADIDAAVVRIIGVAKGNITASDKVEILSRGRYTGNIKSMKLVVADGAVLNGFVNEQEKKYK